MGQLWNPCSFWCDSLAIICDTGELVAQMVLATEIEEAKESVESHLLHLSTYFPTTRIPDSSQRTT